MTLDLFNNDLPAREVAILRRAIDALHQVVGLDARVITTQIIGPLNQRADAIIEIDFDGHKQRYAAEIKHLDRFAALGGIKHQLDLYEEPGLLIAPRITTEMAERCREHQILFIDTAGNAYLRAKGIFIFITGQRFPRGEEIPIGATGPRVGTATAQRIIFTLLCKPELLNAPYREIVQAARVALGAVGWVFFDLNARGFTIGGKNQTRRLVEPTRLFDEWVTNYPIKLRPKLNPRRFRALENNWWKNVDVIRYGATWGGEVAAQKLTGYLRPETCTIYIQPDETGNNLKKLVLENRLRADPKGDIEVLDAFWDYPADTRFPETVPPILAYADLVATMDPRNLEVAKLIREQYIDHALRQF
jgi:hypothetical protein